MNLLITAFVVALLVAVWWLHRKRSEASAQLKETSILRSQANTEFHAVSIKFEGSACRAAQDMTGRRFLASAAPKLPLPECDSLDCKCRFAHYKDRRASKDRRSPFRAPGFDQTGAFDAQQRPEQRVGEDRRDDD